MDAILMWGIGVVLALQALSSPALDGIFLAITQLGGELFFFLLIPLIYWCFDKRLGIRLAVLFLLSAVANLWLKALFNTPRPYQVDSRVRLIGHAETNPGFPSGHAQSTTTVWVELGRRVRRGWMWAAATVVVALVSLSRVYLGVHFPHDVIGGVLFGLAAIALFARFEPALSRRWAALTAGAQVALSLVAPIALLMVNIDRDTAAALGALAGLSAGYVVQHRWAGFAADGPVTQRVLRFVGGAIGVLALYLGLRSAFGSLAGEENTPLWYALRYVRYGLTGLWAGGLWPMAAVRLRLALRESPADSPA